MKKHNMQQGETHTQNPHFEGTEQESDNEGSPELLNVKYKTSMVNMLRVLKRETGNIQQHRDDLGSKEARNTLTDSRRPSVDY